MTNSGTTQPRAYVTLPGGAETRWMGETRTHFLATGASTGGAFCLVDETAMRGEAVPMHRHAGDVESFYVVEGELAFFIDGQPPVRAGAGAFAHVPAGVAHGFRIESRTARYLILTTARHGEFYRAISFPAGPSGQKPPHEVDWAVIEAACREYEIEFIGPLPD